MVAFSTFTALAAAAIVTFVSAQEAAQQAGNAEVNCESYIPIHKIFSQPNNNYVFSDDREIRADNYDIGGCTPYPQYRTGSVFTGNYTLMGHEALVDNTDCLIQDDTYSSFQAVVVRSNGWLFDAETIDLDDIDSQTDVPMDSAWRESMAVFAKSGDKVIFPSVMFHDGTLLTSKSYTVPNSAMKEMGFSNTGGISVPGGEFGGDILYNCPFGRENELSKKCRMTVKFTEPIDTLAILYGITQKSGNDPNAAVFFSELALKCGCRCTDKPASAEGMVPVPGQDGECFKSTTTRPRVRCDVLGDKFCSTATSNFWEKIQEEPLQNGNYRCALHPSKVTRVVSDFKPLANFNHNS